MTFQLGAVLERDSTYITDLGLSEVRLMNNADFPWVILVPRLTGACEITDLTNDQYLMLNAEIRLMAKVMEMVFKPDKLNIATIGNKVRQMHYHIVARFEKDAAFPDVVWGKEFTAYNPDKLQERITEIKQILEHK